MSDIHIGIDGGLKGGLVAISDTKGVSEPISCLPMPLEKPGGKEQISIRRIVDWVHETYAKGTTHVWLEKCPHHSMSKAAMRSMAITYGKLIGLFEARFPHMFLHRVSAGQELKGWQRQMFGRAFTSEESKSLALAKARETWPKMQWPEMTSGRIMDGVVDAALIAEFGRRQLSGEFEIENI